MTLPKDHWNNCFLPHWINSIYRYCFLNNPHTFINTSSVTKAKGGLSLGDTYKTEHIDLEQKLYDLGIGSCDVCSILSIFNTMILMIRYFD